MTNDGNKGDNTAAARLRTFVSRIERLEEEKKSVSDAIKDVYAEAKGVGFDPATMKVVIRRRKQSAEKRAEIDALQATYEAICDGHQLELFTETEKENDEEEEKIDEETGEVIDDQDDDAEGFEDEEYEDA
jgi:uncharacterized protein (UPF0335 family)